MIVKLILGAVVGAVVGGLVGYAGKCVGGACPLTCNPIGGTITGILIGVLLASSVMASNPAAANAPRVQSPHVVEIQSAEQFTQALRDNPIALVDFYADWCGPCRMLKPTIHQIADDYAGRVAVLAVNVDNLGDLARQYEANAVPDVRIFSNGQAVERLVGVRGKSTYTERLDKLLGQ